jgi:hypothetical protein
LDQDVEHNTGLVHSSPQPALYPGDFEHDLIEMPFAANSRQAATDLVGEMLCSRLNFLVGHGVHHRQRIR